MKKILIIASILILIVHFSLQSQENISENVKIQSGWILGKQIEKTNVFAFKGIPFATPPVGDLRWKAPQPIKPWESVLECIKQPASAMQNKPAPFMCWSVEFLAPVEPISEDCLYLNVWTPAKKNSDKLPVIVWIHGGAFTGGSGTVPLYDGEEISKKGCVFVTINYRLGIFGFYTHPELSTESDDKVSGNYGILDQIAALQWVKQNIKAFGGNPENVTIAGQSAGSFSVNALMVSPKAKGLFHRAIAQSGGMFKKGFGAIQNFKDAEASGLSIAEKAGANSIADLRAKSATDLMSIQGRWGLVLDNIVLPPVYETFEDGKQNDVPLLTGWNADDGVMFGPAQNAETYKAESKKKYSEQAAEILKLFPAQTDEEAKSSQKLLSQLGFGWQNFSWARMQTKTGKGKVWLYYFSQIPPGEPNYGAFHSAEFAYALKTLKYWNRPFTKSDYELEDIMSSYWVNFAKTGNPNAKDLPKWPQFDTKAYQIIELGNQVKSKKVPNFEQLIFLDKLN